MEEAGVELEIIRVGDGEAFLRPAEGKFVLFDQRCKYYYRKAELNDWCARAIDVCHISVTNCPRGDVHSWKGVGYCVPSHDTDGKAPSIDVHFSFLPVTYHSSTSIASSAP